ncbi:hypothetical protein [Cryobacterium sp. Y11]|uniref:hypothetical protein n=1 Tax=Cryobacterium sp. Y11 TaxID=2045016 RepID=UPI000CE55C92|nr:hypothetical protein [Cryobacterium sp. Y11]
MKAETVTVGVRDLDRAIALYQSAVELGETDQITLDGLAEFDLGAFWLQLALAPDLAGRDGISVNISVQNAAVERERFVDQGLTVTEL